MGRVSGDVAGSRGLGEGRRVGRRVGATSDLGLILRHCAPLSQSCLKNEHGAVVEIDVEGRNKRSKVKIQ